MSSTSSNSPKSRNISAFFFFYFASVAVYVIFMPKVVSDIGYSSSEIGIIFATAPLMRFLTPFIFLKKIKMDKTIYSISSVTLILSIFTFYFTIENFYLFILSNLLFGASMSLTLPYIETFALAILKDRYGKSRLYGSIGFMAIALVLAQYLTSSYIAISFLFVSVILTSFFGFLVSSDEEKVVKNETVDNSGISFSFSKHWKIWASFFLMQVSFGAFYNFFTIYATEHNISIELTSYLWSFGVLCEIVMLYFQAPILKNSSLLKVIQFTTFITALRWFLMFLFPNSIEIYFLTQSFHAFSFALYHSAVLSYIYNLYSNKKLASQFFYGFSYGLGGFVGAFFAGIVYGEYIFLSSSIIAFFAFLMLKSQNSKSKLQREKVI